MNNIILICSIINTPNLPLSYHKTRSIYNPDERFNQTVETINSINNKIPNPTFIIIECSELNESHEKYFKSVTNHFINLYNNNELKQKIYSKSKSLGEGTMTIAAIEYIINNNLLCDNFFKITGRYTLTDNFNYDNFVNKKNVCKTINNNLNNIVTSLYKLNPQYLSKFLSFLKNKQSEMIKCIGYEVLFASFIKYIDNNYINTIFLNTIGIKGNIAVDGSLYDG